MASYTNDVKEELTSLPVHPEHAKAKLAAFLRMNGVLSLHDHQFSLDIIAENPAIARRVFSLTKTAYEIEPLLVVSKKMKLKKNYQYLVRLQKQVHEILSDLEIFDSDNGLITGIPEKIMTSEQRAMSCSGGVFLAARSVNNPETSRYHLETYSLYENHNSDLLELMNSLFYLSAKAAKRRNGYIVYLKEAEEIGDFLHIVGAVNVMLALENLRIMRNMRNLVNRLVNCDITNLKKTADAAAKQIEDTQLVEEKVGLENLPEKLTILAYFRLMHPKLSFKEVAAQVPGGPISKSGVNHRFQKIREIA